MPYFDGIDDQQQTPDAEAEARRRVLGMIASSGKVPILGQPTAQPDAQPAGIPPRSTMNPVKPAIPPALSSTATPLGGGQPTPLRANVAPTREDFPAKPEVGGWKKYLGLGLAALSGPQSAGPLAERILHGQRDDANQRYTQATQDWERSINDEAKQATTAETRAKTQQILNPPAKADKPENIDREAFDYYVSQGMTPAKARQQVLQDAADAKAKDPVPPKENKAVQGTYKGQPAFAVQTDNGWVSVDPAHTPMPEFQPPPSFAETGLWEPTMMPDPSGKGGMVPAKFNKRTGETVPITTGKGGTSIPKPAQKEIDESLNQARTMDRLDSAQKEILKDVESRGQKGPLGGGPYLNGPESMQFLANHVAMTLGGIKGVRPGRDLIEAHVKARDLDQATEALAQQVLAGGVITYSQAQQMLGTTAVNRKTIWRQAKQTAEQYGVPDAVKLPSDIGGGEPPTDKSRWQKNAKGEYRYSNDGGKTWNDYNQ